MFSCFCSVNMKTGLTFFIYLVFRSDFGVPEKDVFISITTFVSFFWFYVLATEHTAGIGIQMGVKWILVRVHALTSQIAIDV